MNDLTAAVSSATLGSLDCDKVRGLGTWRRSTLLLFPSTARLPAAQSLTSLQTCSPRQPLGERWFLSCFDAHPERPDLLCSLLCPLSRNKVLGSEFLRPNSLCTKRNSFGFGTCSAYTSPYNLRTVQFWQSWRNVLLLRFSERRVALKTF